MKSELTPRQIMNRIYKDICGFEIPKDDEQQVRKSKGSPVYGEINHISIAKLLEYLNLSKQDIFYDLGSGVGKVVVQTALFSDVKKAVGIELSEQRHRDAQMALDRAILWEPSIKKRCELKNADLMETDLSKATVVYTCSTAFSARFMNQVTKRLAKFTHDFRLVTLQDLPFSKNFLLVDTIYLNMSWIRHTPVYIYRRQPTDD
jgi:hypothetical protein